MARTTLILLTILMALLVAEHAGAVQIRDICRLKGAESNKLIGMGIVVGLNGTGDGGKFLPSMRMLAEAVGHFADPNVLAGELRDSKNVALVYLSAELPGEGVAEGDRVDITISAAGPAKSLRGGTLFMTPMTGPRRDSPVMAFAEGKISLPDEGTPTVGVVHGGAQLVRDVYSVLMDQGFRIRLVVHESYAGWASTNAIASQINGVMAPDGPELAKAIDGKNVLIDVPFAQRQNPAQFVNDIMITYLDMSFVSGGAKVVINERSGTIVISGEVTVSPVMISHDGLTIARVTPPPTPTPFDPVVEEQPFMALDPEGRGGTKLSDLLGAFNQMKVSVQDQIQIIRALHQSGKLHGQLILE